MFRINKKAPSVDVGQLSSLLAQDTCIRGDVVFDGGMRIDGRIEGNVMGKSEGQGLLVLSEKGRIVGTVKVHDAVINGHVEGDLEVEHFLELQAGARITGNISYRTLKLDCGATVEGKLVRMDGGPVAASGAEEEAEPGNVVSFAGGT
jgi:cytoskeletal protein CcmA (bactofilin family)